MTNIFHAITKLVDFHEGEELTIWLNENQALEYGITAMDKVSLIYKGKEYVLDANLTHKYVDQHEVGIPKDVAEKYDIRSGERVHLSFTQTTSAALDALKRVMK